MNKLLLRLLALLLPGIDNDDQVDEPVDDPSDDPSDDPTDDPVDEPTDPSDDPTDDPADPDLVDPEPAPRETRAQKTIRETRERAQRAEADLAAARRDLEAARRGPAPTAQPDPEQVLWQQEEETLRNPEANDWQKYAIQSARAARSAQRDSRQALAHAQDVADRAEFAALATGKPKLYAAYKDRVEDRLKTIRERGGSITRTQLLTVMLGEDMLAGKVKTAEGGGPKKVAPRGAAPRSDVPARPGRLSEQEARAKRLENVRI